MLRTYSLTDSTDFILYLLDKQQEDLLWETWVHRSPTNDDGDPISYADYKKVAGVRSIRDITTPTLTAEQEKKNIEFASQFIKNMKKETD